MIGIRKIRELKQNARIKRDKKLAEDVKSAKEDIRHLKWKKESNKILEERKQLKREDNKFLQAIGKIKSMKKTNTEKKSKILNKVQKENVFSDDNNIFRQKLKNPFYDK